MTSINIEVTPEFVQAVAAALAQIVNANGSANTAVAPPVATQQDPWATTPGVPTDQTYAAPSAPVAPPFVPNVVPNGPAPVAPPLATQQPQAAQTGTITINAPSGPQTWTLDAPNAPSCNCIPAARAAYVKGTTSKGRPYAAWRCAKAAGSNWKAKCDFNEWA